MDIFITFMLWYFFIGVNSFVVVLGLFVWIMPKKLIKDQLSKPKKAGFILLALGGFIADILWDIFYASFMNYGLDRITGHSHADSKFMQSFKGLKWNTLDELTVTHRLQCIIDRGNVDFLSYRVAYSFSIFLNKYDENHIKLEK